MPKFLSFTINNIETNDLFRCIASKHRAGAVANQTIQVEDAEQAFEIAAHLVRLPETRALALAPGFAGLLRFRYDTVCVRWTPLADKDLAIG